MSACNTAEIYQDDRYNPPVYWGHHEVQKGDTLYSIAWRYGRDYRELAAANGIAPPYRIEPGQTIRLDRKLSDREVRRFHARHEESPPPSRPARAKPETSRPKSRPSNTASAGNTQLQTRKATNADISWRWPHVGPILAKYSVTGRINKGIDIAGEAGDPIRAAADGEVVYAGNGLLGYGNLVIVNHNEHYLSAYAHNRSIKVREGERVRQGQTIAEMGSSGTSRTKLHFEIRRNGEPVDPQQYLPGR